MRVTPEEREVIVAWELCVHSASIEWFKDQLEQQARPEWSRIVTLIADAIELGIRQVDTDNVGSPLCPGDRRVFPARERHSRVVAQGYEGGRRERSALPVGIVRSENETSPPGGGLRPARTGTSLGRTASGAPVPRRAS